MSLGPEQIEEKGTAEDERNCDSTPDIVRGSADEVVVPDVDARVLPLDITLLVDVVWDKLGLAVGILTGCGARRKSRHCQAHT